MVQHSKKITRKDLALYRIEVATNDEAAEQISTAEELIILVEKYAGERFLEENMV